MRRLNVAFHAARTRRVQPAFAAAVLLMALSRMIVLVAAIEGCGGGNFERLLVGERQKGIALRTGEAAAALLIRKEDNKKSGEQQTEEDGEWDDGHGVVCPAAQFMLRLRGTGRGGRSTTG